MQKFPTDETPRDIVAKSHAYLATKTHALGNTALAFVIGNQVWLEGCRKLDEVAGAGDLAATKVAGRQYIRDVLELLATLTTVGDAPLFHQAVTP